ncbi:MAG TPA: metal-dependent hydrolase [Candidatus Saccharimonadales bacterium]|nr:metal-dependent hydrolase [Candidatus Saccharimonadales bacterium]
MANYKGHIAGGLGAGLVYVSVIMWAPISYFAEVAGVLQGWEAIAAVFVLAMLFGLFPDVDTNSKAQDIFLGTAFLIDVLLILNGDIQAAAYLGLIAMLPIVTHHRGWTHTKWAMLVVPLPILAIPWLYNPAMLPVSIAYYGAAVVGYFSHLLLDGLIIKQIRVKT